MTFEVFVTPGARRRIREQAEWIVTEQRAPENAARWLERIYDAIDRLESMPRRFEVARLAAASQGKLNWPSLTLGGTAMGWARGLEDPGCGQMSQVCSSDVRLEGQRHAPAPGCRRPRAPPISGTSACRAERGPSAARLPPALLFDESATDPGGDPTERTPLHGPLRPARSPAAAPSGSAWPNHRWPQSAGP